MRKAFAHWHLDYRQKIMLLASIPLILAVTAIAILTVNQSRQLAEREIEALEAQLIETKKAELKNYVTQARNGFYYIYGNAHPEDESAKLQIAQILAAMVYGEDGFFFVYDYDGNNVVSPRQTHLINKNWSGLTDSEGTPVVDELIRIGRTGSGYHSYLWEKPSTGEEAQMISYITSFPVWRWVVGTGVFVDDVTEAVAAARADVEARIQRTFFYTVLIAAIALLSVFATGMFINVRERRLADAKLNELTQRIIDTQEEERGRVARELHDGISQILIGARYALELAQRRLTSDSGSAQNSLATGIEGLNTAAQEVRRISRDLRPAILDDLGLGPALKALTEEFAERTGIATDLETVVFRNRLDQNSKIALYRIAQEALTNIERHADATEVHVQVSGHRRGATMRISDNGTGIVQGKKDQPAGLGLRNMQERMEQLNGSLRILSTREGTVIEARVPLSHMLAPDSKKRKSA